MRFCRKPEIQNDLPKTPKSSEFANNETVVINLKLCLFHHVFSTIQFYK